MDDHINEDLPCYGLYIDGSWVDAEGARCRSTSRRWGDRWRGSHAAPPPMLTVRSPLRAKPSTVDHGPILQGHERARILNAIADLIEENTAEFAELETRNLGAPLRKTTFVDIPWSVEHLRVFAELATIHPYEPLPWTDVPSVSWNFVWREPIGVCGQIVPWNYPLLMTIWKIAPALAAGNTIVLKPASYTPLTALRLTQLIHEAGLLPRGVLNVVTGPERRSAMRWRVTLV
jgi:aldehyde dehydrogenase (NAD+)